MKKLLVVGCLVVFALVGTTAEYLNPILPGFYSDPSVCRGRDGRFYLATSSLQFFPGIPIFVSDNLIDWRLIGHAITRPQDLPMFDKRPVSGTFAPTFRYAQGKYHIIVPNNGDRSDGKRDGNLYLVAERPEGPWNVRHARVPHADPSIDFIDGEWHYTATDGHGIYYGRFDPETASVTGGVKVVWRGTGGIWPEGPHIFKRGEWYYLLIAEGGTQYGHKCVIARSRRPDGPYESCPANPILTHACHEAQSNAFQGVGHGDFVVDGNGAWWYVFHAFRKQDAKHHLLGRETMLAPVEWGKDDWPVVNGGKPLSDRKFNTSKLPEPDWVWIRTPNLGNYRFDGDAIELTAVTKGLSDFGSPTFVGTRQTAINQSFEVVLEAADDSVQVGVSAYMNRPMSHSLVISREHGRRMARVDSVLAGKLYEGAKLPVAEGALELRIEATAKSYRFYVGDRLVGDGPARLISSETDDTFNGIIFGVFAKGEGRARFNGCRLTLDGNSAIPRKWAKYLEPPTEYAAFERKTVKRKVEDRGEFTVETHEQANGPTTYQRVCLAIPKSAANGRVPAVVVPYYAPERMLGEDPTYTGRTFMLDLVRRGFITISAEAYYLTYDRVGAPTDDWAKWKHVGDKLSRDWPSWTGIGKLAFDTRLLVDLLAADPRVDASRIGIIGQSLGGKMSFYAGMLDRRIKAVVASDFGIGWDQTNWKDSWYWGGRLAEAQGEGLDHSELIAAAHGKPLMIVAGKYDNWQSYLLASRGLASSALADGSFVFLNHATGHAPPPEAAEAAYRFLEHHLKSRQP